MSLTGVFTSPFVPALEKLFIDQLINGFYQKRCVQSDGERISIEANLM